MEPTPPDTVEPEPPEQGLYTPLTGAQQWRGRLAGHALAARGEAYLAPDCYRDRCSTNLRQHFRQASELGEDEGGPGHGLCECGQESPHTETRAQRRTWHREHKARVHLGLPEPEDTSRGG